MRYEFIRMCAGMYLVLDTADNTRKLITDAEMLEDIFADPIFDDIEYPPTADPTK